MSYYEQILKGDTTMRRILAIAIGAMMLLSVIPQVSAVTSVSGTITSVSCGSGSMVVMGFSGNVTCTMTSQTSIYVNGSPAQCSDLESGMRVMVVGEYDGSSIEATRIQASGGKTTPPKDEDVPFNLSGTLSSKGCPSSISVSTITGTITLYLWYVNHQERQGCVMLRS